MEAAHSPGLQVPDFSTGFCKLVFTRHWLTCNRYSDELIRHQRAICNNQSLLRFICQSHVLPSFSGFHFSPLNNLSFCISLSHPTSLALSYSHYFIHSKGKLSSCLSSPRFPSLWPDLSHSSTARSLALEWVDCSAPQSSGCLMSSKHKHSRSLSGLHDRCRIHFKIKLFAVCMRSAGDWRATNIVDISTVSWEKKSKLCRIRKQTWQTQQHETTENKRKMLMKVQSRQITAAARFVLQLHPQPPLHQSQVRDGGRVRGWDSVTVVVINRHSSLSTVADLDVCSSRSLRWSSETTTLCDVELCVTWSFVWRRALRDVSASNTRRVSGEHNSEYGSGSTCPSALFCVTHTCVDGGNEATTTCGRNASPVPVRVVERLYRETSVCPLLSPFISLRWVCRGILSPAPCPGLDKGDHSATPGWDDGGWQGDCRDAKCLDCLSLYPFLHIHVYWWFTITQKCDFSDKPEVHTQQCSNNVATKNRDHTSSWKSFYLHYLQFVYLYIHTHLSIYISVVFDIILQHNYISEFHRDNQNI